MFYVSERNLIVLTNNFSFNKAWLWVMVERRLVLEFSCHITIFLLRKNTYLHGNFSAEKVV